MAISPLFIASSKSGSTLETRSHLEYFWERTGGRGAQFAAITDPGSDLEQLAQELLHQYEVVCGLPDGVKPGDKVAVSSKRKGVTLRASSRLPE